MSKFFVFVICVCSFLYSCNLSNRSDMVTNLNGSSVKVDSVFNLFDSLLLDKKNDFLDSTSGELKILDSTIYYRNFFWGLINKTLDTVNRDFLLVENVYLSHSCRYDATLVMFNTKKQINLLSYNSIDGVLEPFTCIEREEFYYDCYCVRPTFPPDLEYSKVVSSRRIESAFVFSRFSRYPSEITSNVIFNHRIILDTLRKSSLLDSLNDSNFDYHVLYVILSDFKLFPIPSCDCN